MKKTIFFSLFIFTSILSYSTESWFIGTWEGKGIQIDGLTWEIKVSVNEHTQVKVEYADLKCNGVWNFTRSKGKGKKLYYTERIEQGTEHCDQGCIITVTRQGTDEIKVTFVLRSIHKRKPIATATLSRVSS